MRSTELDGGGAGSGDGLCNERMQQFLATAEGSGDLVFETGGGHGATDNFVELMEQGRFDCPEECPGMQEMPRGEVPIPKIGSTATRLYHRLAGPTKWVCPNPPR